MSFTFKIEHTGWNFKLHETGSLQSYLKFDSDEAVDELLSIKNSFGIFAYIIPKVTGHQSV